MTLLNYSRESSFCRVLMKLAAIHVCTSFGVMVSILLPQAAAVCCAGRWPFRCCGAHYSERHSGCNIFCCNCDGGKCLGEGMTKNQMSNAIRYAKDHDHKWKGRCFEAAEYDQNESFFPLNLWKRSARFDISAKYNNEAELLFSKVDINGDDYISTEEAEIFFEKQDHYNRTNKRRSANNFFVGEEIRKMDENRDGLLSPSEFDESLRN